MCEREREREREVSERVRIFCKFFEPLEKIRARFLEEKFLQELRTWCAKNKRIFRRTFDVGFREVQLLDLRGPWHGRQHLEGLLAVNVRAFADAEL